MGVVTVAFTVHILSKNMTGEEIAHELITALSAKFGISSDLACMKIVPLSSMLQSISSMMYLSLMFIGFSR